MQTQVPDIRNAQRTGFCPSPALDDDSSPLRRILSARKYMAIINELIALGLAVYAPIHGNSGSDINAGPVVLQSWHTGGGYLVNGAALQGASSILVDTGTLPIAIGDVFTITGQVCNPENDLQTFVATSAIAAGAGAGTLSFTPPLTSNLADNTPIFVNAGFKIRLADGGGTPDSDLNLWLVLNTIPQSGGGVAVKVGEFTSTLDCSGATVGDPVYLTSSGVLSLTDFASATEAAIEASQIIGTVKTATNPGVINGLIQPAFRIGQKNLQTGAILGQNVGASTTDALYPPRMTTAQKNALSFSGLVTGAVVFDTNLGRLEVYNGSVWGPAAATSGSGALDAGGALYVSGVFDTAVAVIPTWGPVIGSGKLRWNPTAIQSDAGAADAGITVYWIAL